jgi:hypothetical protein
MGCWVDATSGYVMGLRYGWVNQAGNTRVCGAATGTIAARGNSALNGTGFVNPNRGDTTLNYQLWFNQTSEVGTNALTQTEVGVEALEVMAFPGTRARGRIPAIKVYLARLDGTESLGYVVCGRQDLVEDGALQTAAIYTSPVEPSEEDPAPRFLGSFQGKCAKRNLINNPNDATFFLQSIQKPCWTTVPETQLPVPL